MSAKYKALGAGLMAFGSGLQQQMAETARQRREESLLALKRQWQMEDREEERNWQTGLLDRQEETAERNRQRAFDDQIAAAQINRGFANMDADRDWERTADDRERAARMDEGRIDLLDAQIEGQKALAEQRRRQEERGSDGLTAAERNVSLTFRRDARQTAERVTQDMFRIDSRSPMNVRVLVRQDPEYAASLGITEDTSLREALRLVEDDLYFDRIARFGSQFGIEGEGASTGEPEEPEGSEGSRNNPIPVETLNSPDELVVGRFYLVEGRLMQWTGQGWR